MLHFAGQGAVSNLSVCNIKLTGNVCSAATAGTETSPRQHCATRQLLKFWAKPDLDWGRREGSPWKTANWAGCSLSESLLHSRTAPPLWWEKRRTGPSNQVFRKKGEKVPQPPSFGDSLAPFPKRQQRCHSGGCIRSVPLQSARCCCSRDKS